MGWEGYSGWLTQEEAVREVARRCVVVRLERGRKGDTMRGVWYAAVNNGPATKTFGLVLLVEGRAPNISVKAISEDMGPYYWGASDKLLALLDEPCNEAARGWRHKCRGR